MIDAEYVDVTPRQKRRFPWFSVLYSLAFYGGCIAIAASNEDAWTRGAAAFGAAIFAPTIRFFSLARESVSEQEEQQLRWRLLTRPATVWAERAARRDRG